MERIFVADFVMHSADQYLVVGVHFHFGRWFSEFPSELKYCFDERFVFQGFSGHFYSLRVFSKGVVSYNWQRGLGKVGKRTLWEGVARYVLIYVLRDEGIDSN